MKKKMLSLVLAGVFAFGAVACGGGDDAGTTDTATTGTTGDTATTAPTEATS